MKKNTISTLLLPFVLIGSLLSLNQSCTSSEGENEDKKEEVFPVTSSAPKKEIFQEKEEYSVFLEAQESYSVLPLISGKVVELNVEVGAFIKAETILARMDSKQMDRVELQFNDAKKTFERAKELYAIGGISQMEFEARNKGFELAENSFLQVQENTILKSPISGVVTARNYDEGAVCNPQLPVFVVQNIDILKFRCNVPERYFVKVKKGAKVSLKIPALRDEVVEGRISLIYPSIDPATHTFIVEAEISNKTHKIRSGMYAHASLEIEKREVLTISDKSVLRQRGTSDFYVFIIKNGRAKRRSVSLGVQIGGRVEVLLGVNNEDLIIEEGATLLYDGAKVSVKS